VNSSVSTWKSPEGILSTSLVQRVMAKGRTTTPGALLGRSQGWEPFRVVDPSNGGTSIPTGVEIYISQGSVTTLNSLAEPGGCMVLGGPSVPLHISGN
jgi:hypothetical protein